MLITACPNGRLWNWLSWHPVKPKFYVHMDINCNWLYVRKWIRQIMYGKGKSWVTVKFEPWPTNFYIYLLPYMYVGFFYLFMHLSQLKFTSICTEQCKSTDKCRANTEKVSNQSFHVMVYCFTTTTLIRSKKKVRQAGRSHLFTHTTNHTYLKKFTKKTHLTGQQLLHHTLIPEKPLVALGKKCQLLLVMTIYKLLN